MIGTVYRFELAYHFRRPVTYLYALVFLLLGFSFSASNVVQLSGAGELVKINSPFVLAQLQLILTVVGQVIVTALVGTAVLRDYQVGAHELLFTTPISRAAYLGGRFLGALTVMALVFAAIPIGAAIGTFMPWVDRAKLLPFSAVNFIHPFLLLVLPTVVLLAAIFFAVGALTRNLFAIYTQGVLLLVAWTVTSRITRDLDNRHLAALVDPFGISAFNELTRYWTVAERNTRLTPLVGDLLLNRLFWLGVAVALIAFTYWRFRFRSQGPALAIRKKTAELPFELASPIRPARLATQQFTAGARWRQFLSITRLSTLSIVREVPFLAITTIGMVNLVMTSWYADSLYGQTIWPVTYSLVETLSGAFFLFFVIITTIYAGEAVWRERQLKLDQVSDTLPVPSSVTFLGKFAGLLVVDVLLVLLLIATGLIVQAAKGYYHFEPGLYFTVLFGTTLPALLQLTALAFLVHTIVNQKFLGHVVMIVCYILYVVMGNLGIEHRLFHYAQIPPFTYSDMNGFGPFVPSIVLTVVYWSGAALLVGITTYLLWVRGTGQRWAERRAGVKTRFTGTTALASAVSLALFVGAGGAIFYNTNVRNRYETSKERRHRQAEYERSYRKLKDLPQPRLVDAKVRADLEPEHRAFTLSGTFTYVNKAARPIDSVIITTTYPRIRLDTLAWNRPTAQVLSDSAHGTRIVRFTPALAVGDTAQLRYRARWEEHGFRNDGPGTVVVDNGTFVNSAYFPELGYREGAELGSDDDRRKEKLPPKVRMPSINDEAARANSYLASDADWITFAATVSTAPDQIAIAPGYLVREYQENGRRVFEYQMDRPILNFYSFLSGRFAVKRDQWNGVNLEIYYHPGHEYNLDRMMAAMKAALEYNTVHFSPYQFRQVRILEFPRYAGFAQAFPNTVPYSESVGFVLRARDRDEDIDMPFFVTAHEVGHQWWGHQVVGANMQGSTLFSEGLAEYSALTAMERRYGSSQAQKFLAYELDQYLSGRTTETKKELPLMLVENQPYIHYNKGSLAFYALRDLIGEDSLNVALSRFVRDNAFKAAPYPNTKELMGYLNAVTADSLKYILTDLFETITLWDNRTESASATRRPDGKYAVTLTVKSLKFRADSLGNETGIPMADYVDIGVFGAREKGSPLGRPLYLAKRKITAPTTEIEVVVDQRPERAGIDPYNKLVDRSPKDNVRAVRVQ